MATRKSFNFADHIKRSVSYDEFTQIDHVVILRRGAEVMTCEIDRKGGDTRVSVASPGLPWRTSMVNDTTAVDQMWTR